ncbi:hypothetical protein [Photobacterium atrarenae]|uniref:TIGR02646 family protein n=1 Tax=Photobacterium atrarenae TaxID=865757 RepID=A0ABY5GDD0_9GAMM|nr:hypothetical protein [Photobacterium atrarenae]UTV27210.1 hypothetical protein NNL38_12840 [Photobacterium atrarenae]
MHLGPETLGNPLRRVFKKNKHKKIIKKYHSKKLKWTDAKLKELKKDIRFSLRKAQDNRCIYCRRIIKNERRNAFEDIEHYLDKSKQKYKKWTFSPINLVLSCRTCNFIKSTKDLGGDTLLQTENIKDGIGGFKWIHPYFDNYHLNIKIDKGWVYSIPHGAPNSIGARNLITDCMLDDIQTLEAYSENKKKYEMRLTLVATKAVKKGKIDLALSILQKLEEEKGKNWFDS